MAVHLFRLSGHSLLLPESFLCVLPHITKPHAPTAQYLPRVPEICRFHGRCQSGSDPTLHRQSLAGHNRYNELRQCDASKRGAE